MDEQAKKVLSRLEAQCSRREYCSGDVLSKAVKALDGNADQAAEILDSLIKDGFVSDGRYASAYAREKAQIDGWGPIKIRHALSVKGIGREVIDAALQEVDDPAATARLERLLASKARSLEGDPQARLKLIRFALSRGYEYSQVQKLV